MKRTLKLAIAAGLNLLPACSSPEKPRPRMNMADVINGMREERFMGTELACKGTGEREVTCASVSAEKTANGLLNYKTAVLQVAVTGDELTLSSPKNVHFMAPITGEGSCTITYKSGHQKEQPSDECNGIRDNVHFILKKYPFKQTQQPQSNKALLESEESAPAIAAY